MTELQRLLALDAALCAFEGYNCSTETKGASDLLRMSITREIDNCDDIPPIFGHFLTLQMESVKALAENPQAFGAR